MHIIEKCLILNVLWKTSTAPRRFHYGALCATWEPLASHTPRESAAKPSARRPARSTTTPETEKVSGRSSSVMRQETARLTFPPRHLPSQRAGGEAGRSAGHGNPGSRQAGGEQEGSREAVLSGDTTAEPRHHTGTATTDMKESRPSASGCTQNMPPPQDSQLRGR